MFVYYYIYYFNIIIYYIFSYYSKYIYYLFKNFIVIKNLLNYVILIINYVFLEMKYFGI